MPQANLVKQLVVKTENKVGMFAEVTSVIADVGLNITAICAYAKASKAIFYVITSDNIKAREVLINKGFKVKKTEVVTVMLEDKSGQAKEIAKKLKNAAVDLEYVYGTACGCADTKALLVLGAKDKEKLLSVLNS